MKTWLPIVDGWEERFGCDNPKYEVLYRFKSALGAPVVHSKQVKTEKEKNELLKVIESNRVELVMVLELVDDNERGV